MFAILLVWLDLLRSLFVDCRLLALVLAVQKYRELCKAAKAAVAVATVVAGKSATAVTEASRRSADAKKLADRAIRLVVEDSHTDG